MVSIDRKTILAALRSGEANRVNDVLDAVEDAEPTEQAEILSACFDDCRRLYDEAEDGYQRQSVVRFLAAADPHLATNKAHGNVELNPDDFDLTEDADDYRDVLVEFYLTALQDEDGRVRNAAKRELTPLSVRWEMLGEQTRLEALCLHLDDLAEDATGKKRDHIVETRNEVQAHAKPGGMGLRSAFEQVTNEMQNLDE